MYNNPNGGISLKAVSNGKFVQSNNRNQNIPLKAKGNHTGDWERFTWKNKGTNRMALKSEQTNKWVQASWNQNYAVLYPKGPSDRGWETFEYTILGNSPNNKEAVDMVSTFNIEAYPNPIGANEQLLIDVITSNNANVELSIFDIQGKLLYTETFNDLEQGGYTVTLDTKTIFKEQKGVYILKAKSGTYQKVIKLML